MRTTAWARTWSVMRLAMAALIAAAVIAQLTHTIQIAGDAGRDVSTTVANFFSFFTILSNIAAAVVIACAAIWWFARGRHAAAEPALLALALASVTTYMIITGIVYNTLLRSVILAPGTTVPWTNEVLHLIAPLFLLADLFVGPLRRALPWRALWAIVAFPIVWVAYTLLRGTLVTNPVTSAPYWYPYPFLDPNGPGGWGSVVFYVVLIAAAVLIVAALVIGWGRRVGRERELDHESGDHLEDEWREAREAQLD
ncbi:MAG: Pr6Pr family membrane protein [Microbacterium sp.]